MKSEEQKREGIKRRNRERVDRWRERNLEHYREYTREAVKKHIRKVKSIAHKKLGNKCVRCGFDDVRALQIDHIYGDGKEERKKGITGVNLYRKIRDMENPELKYQLLCANCNWIKRWENNEHSYDIKKGSRPHGRPAGKRKIPIEEYKKILEMHEQGKTLKEMCDMYNVTNSTIWRCLAYQKELSLSEKE